MFKYILIIANALLFIACNNATTIESSAVLKRNYLLSNDSIEQTLELFSLGDSTMQFTLRVENKYRDTLDSYMSHATSTDNRHFTHERENCVISFSMKGVEYDTLLLSQCDCPELTVSPIKGTMATDSAQIIVYR